MSQFVTALDVAKARGAKADAEGRFSMGAIESTGIPFMGGCVGCEASIACYNAYPSTSGYWRCGDCIGDDGFRTVLGFEGFCAEQDAREREECADEDGSSYISAKEADEMRGEARW